MRNLSEDSPGDPPCRRGGEIMTTSPQINRRDFLKAGLTGGTALVVGFYLPVDARGLTAQSGSSNVFKPNAWIRIGSDNLITVVVAIPEMGQGPRTAIP